MASDSSQSKTGSIFTLALVDTSQKPQNSPNSTLFEQGNNIRVDTRIKAEVVTEAGESLTGTIVALSGSGLQLVCNRKIMDCLQTGFLRFIRCKPTTLQLSFSLPSNLDPFDPVKVQCKTVYARNTKHNTARIGMKFLVFNEGKETLAEYLTFREAID